MDTITAYDSTPPAFDPAQGIDDNLYFDRTYTKVYKGTCETIFATNNPSIKNAGQYTLLMVWPNNPDNVDNAKEFRSPRLPPVWDMDCVQTFLAAGGTRVILVAEREINLHILPSHPEKNSETFPESGLCATRALQKLLMDEFQLVHQMDVPTWFYSDDLTVWEKKKGTAQEV